jgi:hypothetical protein
MSGRDSYPIFERDSHGFPIRVRWVERNSVPDAFTGAYFDFADTGATTNSTDGNARYRRTVADSDPSTTDSDPAAHGAT